ncbi:uncharacterized protein [Amphiura filiformis]|uniref:uncharacterized protein n=1 Tax=Amphiura filiformis TaxID=82378 RepID=UPI003B21B632
MAHQGSPRQGPSVKSRIQMFQSDPLELMPPPQTATLSKRGRRSQKQYASLASDSDDSSSQGYQRNQNNNWESRQLPMDYSSSDGLDSDGGDASRKEKTRKKPPTYCKPPVAPADPSRTSSPRSKVPSSPRSKVPVAKYSKNAPWSEDEGASSSSEMPSERRRKPNLRSRPNTPPPPPPPGQSPPCTPRSTDSTPRNSPRPESKPPLTPLQQELQHYMASSAFPNQPKRPAPPMVGIIPATPPPTKRSTQRPQVQEVTATPPPPPAMHVIDFKGQVPPRMHPREQREKKKFSMSLFKKK